MTANSKAQAGEFTVSASQLLKVKDTMKQQGFDVPHPVIVDALFNAFAYAAPQPQGDMYAHLLHMLGAKDHEDAGRIIGQLHVPIERIRKGLADGTLSFRDPQPQGDASPCPCGLTSCVEPWEPGCGLGASAEHAIPVSGGGKVMPRLRLWLQRHELNDGRTTETSELIRDTLAALSTPQARPSFTPEMVREGLAHCPTALTGQDRWQWLTDYFNRALANPNAPCPYCNVTPDGDILDHLPLPDQARPDGGAVDDFDKWFGEQDCQQDWDAIVRAAYYHPSPAPDVARWKIEQEGDTCLVQHPRWGRHVFHAPFATAQPQEEG